MGDVASDSKIKKLELVHPAANPYITEVKLTVKKNRDARWFCASSKMYRKFDDTQPIVVASNWFCTLFLIVGLVMIPILNLVFNQHTFTNHKWTPTVSYTTTEIKKIGIQIWNSPKLFTANGTIAAQHSRRDWTPRIDFFRENKRQNIFIINCKWGKPSN